MLFPTIEFATFFVIVFTGNWLLRPFNTAWRWFILAASCYFYNYQDYGQPERIYLGVGPFEISKYLILFLVIVAVNWALGEQVQRTLGPGGVKSDRSKGWVRIGVILNLGALGYFKYTNFFLDSSINLFKGDDPFFVDLILPIGISFIIFQAMGYVIDIGRGIKARLTLLDLAVYLTFFAHVLAGPIVRSTEFGPQIHTRPDPRRVEYLEAFNLIFRGMFKKVVISSYLAAELVDPVFANPDFYGRASILLAVYGFAIQIYCDFSGYTDIAIGCALLLGIRFPQNFDAPYIARSIQDFWRRWHMTLSRWLRDYLYIPLGGNRLGLNRTYLNLFLTMLIGGFWHGAQWTMVIWGAIHGSALVAERVVKTWWAERQAVGLPGPLVASLQWFLTFNIVCLAWIFFRAPDFGTSLSILSGLVAPSGTEDLATVLGLVIIAGAIASQFVPPKEVAKVERGFAVLPAWAQAIAVGLGFLLIDSLGPEGVPPFIYFQF